MFGSYPFFIWSLFFDLGGGFFFFLNDFQKSF